MRFRNIILSITAGIFLCSCQVVKKSNSKAITRLKLADSTVFKKDTSKNQPSNIKPYGEVITVKAVIHKGLFTVDVLNGRFFLEIPDSLLGKDILVVNRIAQAAAENRPEKGMYGFAGDKINENIIRFCK